MLAKTPVRQQPDCGYSALRVNPHVFAERWKMPYVTKITLCQKEGVVPVFIYFSANMTYIYGRLTCTLYEEYVRDVFLLQLSITSEPGRRIFRTFLKSENQGFCRKCEVHSVAISIIDDH